MCITSILSTSETSFLLWFSPMTSDDWTSLLINMCDAIVTFWTLILISAQYCRYLMGLLVLLSDILVAITDQSWLSRRMVCFNTYKRQSRKIYRRILGSPDLMCCSGSGWLKVKTLVTFVNVIINVMMINPNKPETSKFISHITMRCRLWMVYQHLPHTHNFCCMGWIPNKSTCISIGVHFAINAIPSCSW